MQPSDTIRILLAGLLAGSLCVLTISARSAELQRVHSETIRQASPYHPGSVTSSAKVYYQSVWGIDNMLLRQTASGNLIRFSYRVTDPTLARPLGDNRATPYLFGQRSHAVLEIPVMDKIGQLRQTGTAESGKEYWMVFSNKGNLVKTGDRVNVIIGVFHADGLMVE